ncbi:MAG: hypothetical protein ACXWLR_13110 [Myxococcales bacterium]
MNNHVGFIAAVALFASATAHADTHLGQPASDSVTLEAVNTLPVCPPGFFTLTFVRNLPDGTSVEFAIPPNKVLVVTDLDWQYNSGSPETRQTLRLFLVNKTGPGFGVRVFESTIALDSSGNGGKSEAATSGFVVSAAANICVDASPGGGVLNHLLLRGYLTQNK